MHILMDTPCPPHAESLQTHSSYRAEIYSMQINAAKTKALLISELKSYVSNPSFMTPPVSKSAQVNP